MSYTQEQYESLKRAYATGALSVRHENKTVTFKSLQDMRRLLIAMENELRPKKKAAKDFVGGKAYTPGFKC